ncbi:hypothetical protein EG831_07120, partial [bacterium]|nr:hypothetical protein [bacterium]
MLNGERIAARFLITSLFAMAWVTAAAAAVYHVGPGQSYTQLQPAADLVDPGDTVLVDGDATYDGGVVFTRAGTADAPIVILGVRINGNRPVLSGGTNTVTFESPWPYDSGADHYVFQGFEVAAGTFRGIYHQADDLTVRDVLVRDCPAHGILGADQGSGSCLLEFVEVRNCGNGGSQHQIYMATDEVHHPGSVFRMRHCYVHDGDGGNNVKSRAERNEIHYNWIEGAYYHELELIGCDGGDTGNVHLRREDSDVVGNVLRKRRTAAGNDSNFAVTRIGGDGTGMTHGRYRFANNTILCGTGAVFRCFDTLESVEMHNNVFYRSGGGVNLMRTVDAGWVHDTAVIAGSNNWVYQGAANVPAQWTGTIQGTVWVDTNGDGIKQAGETTGNSGAAVELFTDPNGDGNPADGVSVDSQTSGLDGTYTFSDVLPGDYVIVETNVAGYTSTGDSQGDNDDQISLSLSAGANSSGNDFLD